MMQQEFQTAYRTLAAELGSPVGPSPELLEKRWQGVVGSRLQQSFYYVMDVHTFSVLRTHGFDILGYRDQDMQSPQALLTLIPEFQRVLTVHQLFCIHRVLSALPLTDLQEKQSGLFYVIRRAIQDAEGKIWSCQQTGEPWQYDEAGRAVSYLNWFHLIGPYRSEAIWGRVTHRKPCKYLHTIRRMNNQIELEKRKLLNELKFSVQQRDIIKQLLNGSTTREIAEIWGLSVNGVRYHYNTIKKKLENLFCMEFDSTKEAVSFLAEQQMSD